MRLAGFKKRIIYCNFRYNSLLENPVNLGRRFSAKLFCKLRISTLNSVRCTGISAHFPKHFEFYLLNLIFQFYGLSSNFFRIRYFLSMDNLRFWYRKQPKPASFLLCYILIQCQTNFSYYGLCVQITCDQTHVFNNCLSSILQIATSSFSTVVQTKHFFCKYDKCHVRHKSKVF